MPDPINALPPTHADLQADRSYNDALSHVVGGAELVAPAPSTTPTCADCGQSTGPIIHGQLSGQTFHEDVTDCNEALKLALAAADERIAVLEAWLRAGRDVDGQDRWICSPISATGPIVARGYSTDDIVADTLAQLADQLVARECAK